MNGKILFLAAAAIILMAPVFTKTADAKILPQAKKTVQKSTTAVKVSGIGVYPRLRADRRALIVNFTNLQNAKAVSYFLTYKTNVQDEGAMGGLTLGGSSSSINELLFGTCSKNICRYHTNIKDARLEVSYTLKSNKKYLKKYKIKV